MVWALPLGHLRYQRLFRYRAGDAAPGTVGLDTVTVTVPSPTGGAPLASATAQVEIRADIATIVSFAADKTLIQQGQSATLAWETLNSTATSISGVGSVTPVGTQVVSPPDTTTYTLTANNLGGGASASVKVKVQTDLKWTSDRIYGFGQLLCEDRRQPDNSVATFYIQTD
jgi:hypothetical protein